MRRTKAEYLFLACLFIFPLVIGLMMSGGAWFGGAPGIRSLDSREIKVVKRAISGDYDQAEVMIQECAALMDSDFKFKCVVPVAVRAKKQEFCNTLPEGPQRRDCASRLPPPKTPEGKPRLRDLKL